MTRIKSLHDCASAISDLVNEKIESGNRIEAFSIQLVILAIWKQALDICHTQAASAIKGSPNLDISTSNKISKRERDNTNINEFETVEELTKVIEPDEKQAMDHNLQQLFTHVQLWLKEVKEEVSNLQQQLYDKIMKERQVSKLFEEMR
ncbi:unnamed protein product [Lactuca virosa]|uniref:ATG1a/b/c MIT domain-containing protein n=1 Tax=Lactuca virosa TaxID=75947 RepID=A0AAU9LJ31_9ASTR|nr:unnamed protein product [Lactuca virosa]